MIYLCFMLFFCVVEIDSQASAKTGPRPPKCVPIKMAMCKQIGYNLTYYPNDLNHGSQEEAGNEVSQFSPLVDINCSEDLRLFLCSMYAPICVPNWPNRVPACRSMCISARDGCIAVMRQYGFKWPEKMNCDELPEDNACLRKGNETNSQSYSVVPKKCKCHCRAPLVTDTRDYFNKVFTGGVSNCLMNCHSPYFSDFDKNFPTFWLGLWACLCIVSTSITMATFFIDRTRFQYPERPIIFLSFCYLLMAVGYVVRVALGHEAIACKGDSIRYGQTGTVPCSIVFLLIYFFGMASAIWWVILTATWFLAAGLKWSSEAITMYSDVYHFFAWFIPGFQSIFVLTMTSVDGDPVTGICFVGNTSKFNLLIFVIIPLLVYLVIGTGFLLAGYIALMKIRKTIKQKGESKTDKLENLMLRIGIFGIIYSVPSVTVIFCCVYELLYRDKWERSYTCPCEQRKYHPEYAVFMLKYFMSLIVGTTSGFWVWTSKTLDSWHKVICRSCCRGTYDHDHPKLNKIDIPKSKPETLSTKTLLDCMNSSYNMNGHAIRSSSSMVRSGIAMSNTTESEIVAKLIPLTHV